MSSTKELFEKLGLKETDNAGYMFLRIAAARALEPRFRPLFSAAELAEAQRIVADENYAMEKHHRR